MYTDKLTRLADFIDNYVANRENWEDYFNLESFADGGWKDKECGTTACAVGWGTIEFKNEGLHLFEDGLQGEEYQIGYDMSTKFGLVYRRVTGWNAVNIFFDLNHDEAEYLFASWKYAEQPTSPKTVVNRIREFVKTGEMAP